MYLHLSFYVYLSLSVCVSAFVLFLCILSLSVPVNSPGGVADVHGEVFHLTVDPRLPARVASFGIRDLRMQMN